jgi:hypothetical protein
MGLFDFMFGSDKDQTPNEPIVVKSGVSYENFQLGSQGYKYATSPINTFQKRTSGGWIRFGEDDGFYDNLLFLYNQSPIHRAIIDRKIDMVVGAGYTYDEVAYKALPMEKQVIANKLLRFTDGQEDIIGFLRQIVFDYLLYGQYAFLTNFSNKNTEIIGMKWRDISKIRIKPEDDWSCEIDEFVYCKNFRNAEARANAVCYEPFSVFDKEHDTQLYYYSKPSSVVEWYSLPYYFSAVKWIEIDTLIANLHKSNIINGFSPSTIMIFKENPSPEVKRNITKNIVNSFTNTENYGKIATFFVDDPDLAPDITTFEPNQLHERYTELNTTTDGKILTAHGVTNPELFGIMSSGRLGNTEIDLSYAIFKNSTIKPLQNHFDALINNMLRFNGIDIKFALNEVTLYSEKDLAQKQAIVTGQNTEKKITK